MILLMKKVVVVDLRDIDSDGTVHYWNQQGSDADFAFCTHDAKAFLFLMNLKSAENP